MCLAAAAPLPASAQTAARPDTLAAFPPYDTERTTAEKILAFPSNLLHWATRPVGRAVIWAERHNVATRAQEFFWNDAHTFGVFPNARLGGPTFAAAGFTARHTQLFGARREAEAGFLFSNLDNFRTHLALIHPAPLGPESFAELSALYRTNSEQNLFLTRSIGGRGGETNYRIEQADVRLGLGANPRRGGDRVRLGWGLSARYEWNEIGPGDDLDDDEEDDDDEVPLPRDLAGVGEAHLFTAGAGVLAERVRGERKGQPRILAGSRLFAAYDLTASLDRPAFGYHRLLGEWQQFVPLPLLGAYHRLAFRSRVEKLFPIPGRAVPFYKLSTLGNASTLRGFRQDRFRGEGSVLFTLEYRYPVWTTWDALLFVDSGQTFASFSEVAPSKLRWTAGVGLRIYAGSSVSLRLDIGFGGETLRVFSAAGPGFVSTVRGR